LLIRKVLLVHWPDWMMSATASIDDVLTRRP
jgi:hypothetical protein